MTDEPDAFQRWLRERYGGGLPPTMVVDLRACPVRVPLLYAATPAAWSALRAHNARVGVFDADLPPRSPA